jgi:hypothetical protein
MMWVGRLVTVAVGHNLGYQAEPDNREQEDKSKKDRGTYQGLCVCNNIASGAVVQGLQ